MRRGAISMAFLLAVAACGGGTGTVESSATLPPGPTTTIPSDLGFDESADLGTRAGLAAARAANDGVLPAQEAIDLFSAIFGDVPGADPTRFEVDEHDGSMAIMAVLANWEELTPEQQEAVALVLGGAPPSALGPAPLAAGLALPIRSRSLTALGVSAQVETARAAIEARLGRTLGIPLNVEVRPPEDVTVRGVEVNGYAFPTRGGGFVTSGAAEGCTFRLKDTAVYRTIVHELFHCFQFDAVSDVADVLRGQSWITEGSATWVGAKIAGVDEYAEIRTQQWMANQGSIFALDYPGLVFYWTVEDIGVDPFRVILGMFGNRGEAAVAATGLDPGAVLPRIASERAGAHRRAPTFGVSDVWQLSPAEAPAIARRTPVRVTESSPFEITTSLAAWAPGGLGQVRFEDEGLVHVVVEADAGSVEFEGQEHFPVTGLFDRRFCIRPGGCSCGAEEGEEALPMGSENLLVTGIERDGGQAHFLVELEEFDEEFPSGQWEGTFSITTIHFTAEGLRAVGDTIAAPFTIAVADGVVTGGAYVQSMDQRIDLSGGDYAEGVGVIDGVFTGCAFLPLMIPNVVSFDGIAVFDGETSPFAFEQPLGPGPPGLGPPPWHFDEVTENRVTGSLDNQAYLAFMRAAGLTVDDVEVRFEATRTG
ncbi:MAG TPA: hypothetical protein DCY40_03830 [Actinobacteria bacterium]|nr:hypothetical protein [Actinomycetota bacterium]